MQPSLLLEMTRLVGGVYLPASDGGAEIDRIYAEHIAPKPKRAIDAASSESLAQRFQWFVLLTLLCLGAEALLPDRRTVRAER